MFKPQSIQEIYDKMVTEKNSQSELLNLQPAIDSSQKLLQDLTSTSQVSVWRNIFWNSAYSQFLHQQVMYDHALEVEELIDKSHVGTPAWYAYFAKKFQYGDVLVVNPLTYSVAYPSIDIDKQIIGSSACEESNNQLILKVRRKETNLLSPEELESFQSYIREIKFAGTRLSVRNVNPDNLIIYANIKYNGQTNLTTVKAEVEAVIQDYIKNLDFNSIFYVNKLIDRLQVLDFMIDPQIDLTQSKVCKLSDEYKPLEYEYQAYSGYLEIDPDFPLSETITYTAL